MRVVLDTNIIVSALLAPAGKPAAIIKIWLDGRFTLLSCVGMLLTDAGAGVPIRAINASATKIDVARRFAPDFDAVNEALRAVLAGFK